MYKFFTLISFIFLISCKTTTYYITRHAEKSGTNMTTDPPLTTTGEAQALALKNYLAGKKIKAIYSTNFIRTRSTAEPTRAVSGVEIKIYNPSKLSEFVAELKTISDGNVLIVGHSNTVDDVANGLTGNKSLSDLADSEYGDLFIVTKNGSKYSFERIKVPGTVTAQTN